VEQVERVNHVERVEQVEQVERVEHVNQVEQVDRVERVDHVEREYGYLVNWVALQPKNTFFSNRLLTLLIKTPLFLLIL